MIQFCAPLIPALLTGIFGFGFFLWGKRPYVYPGQPCTFPSMSEEEARKLHLPLLEELVRQAEERMRGQEEAFRSHERKALLLATLCIIMLGHLLSSGDPFAGYRSGASALWLAAAFLPLAVSAVLCMRAIDFTAYSPPGFPPYMGGKILANSHSDNQDGTLQYLLHHLLEEYDKRIENNEQTNNKKYRQVFHARWSWVIGTSAYMGMVAGNRDILSICCWLAK